jgi:hypothetical protein
LTGASAGLGEPGAQVTVGFAGVHGGQVERVLDFDAGGKGEVLELGDACDDHVETDESGLQFGVLGGVKHLGCRRR